MLYLVDANVLITAHNTYYALDRVPEFWDWLLHQAGEGKVAIPLEVLEEVEGVGDAQKDLLYTWRRQAEVHAALVLVETLTGAQVQHVLDQGYGPNLTDVELDRVGRDPFLVAYALANAHERCVVSNETSQPNRQRANRKIPDVCRALGTTSCNVVEFLRSLNFTTGWRG